MSSGWQCDREGYVIELNFVVAVIDHVHADNLMRGCCYVHSTFGNACSLASTPPGYTPDLISFNTAIDACASREKWPEAVQLLEVDMPGAKVLLLIIQRGSHGKEH